MCLCGLGKWGLGVVVRGREAGGGETAGPRREAQRRVKFACSRARAELRDFRTQAKFAFIQL